MRIKEEAVAMQLVAGLLGVGWLGAVEWEATELQRRVETSGLDRSATGLSSQPPTSQRSPRPANAVPGGVQQGSQPLLTLVRPVTPKRPVVPKLLTALLQGRPAIGLSQAL